MQRESETYRARKVDGVDFSRVGLGGEGLLELGPGEDGSRRGIGDRHTLASLSAARFAYMLGWMAMFCMQVAWGSWQREADTLGKATRLEGVLCLADIMSRGWRRGRIAVEFYTVGTAKGRLNLADLAILPLDTVTWLRSNRPSVC